MSQQDQVILWAILEDAIPLLQCLETVGITDGSNFDYIKQRLIQVSISSTWQ